ncbi:neuropeptide SIFamide receptor-like [Ostrea edulis]|uniref:neuropeptide SIFamide receptor-like n=1 Tax=Ostrea edulis TaxID=37623 RepID=UPI002094B53C|nr:neuropeptide SIFamide receptor-like [Ostrea edulis]
MCKATPFIQQVSVCASVNTLALIAVDRYMAICNTWLSKISKTAARAAIVCTWIIAIVLSLPVVIFYEEYESHTSTQVIPICHQIWPNFDLQRAYFVVGLFLLCYVLPLILIVVCYTSITLRVWRRHAPGVSNTCYSGVIHKSKIKVIKMFGIVISLFALSWLPLYVIYFKLYFSPPSTQSNEFKMLFEIIIPLSQWMGLCNCGINPMVYCFYSKKYRHGFKCLMMCKPYFYPTRYFRYHSGKIPTAESSSCRSEERVSTHDRVFTQAKFMLVHYSDGNMTVSFRKEETRQTSI